MNFKGIIFDLDGTLVNSLEDLADSMNLLLQKNNFPIHKNEKYKNFVGNGIRNLIKTSIPINLRDEILIEKMYESLIEIYRQNCLHKTKPYEGIIELLDELVSRKFKLSVFSNKADELTHHIVNALFPDYFDCILGLKSEIHKKPNPWGALEISRIFKLIPSQILYVGDMGVDMQTANNAGMLAVGASWGFRSREELISNGAKIILESPMDLLNLL